MFPMLKLTKEELYMNTNYQVVSNFPTLFRMVTGILCTLKVCNILPCVTLGSGYIKFSQVSMVVRVFPRVKGPIASTYSVRVQMSLLTSSCVQPCVYSLIARFVIDCIGLNITPIYTLS